MTLTRTLTLTDGVQIVVPDNLDLITPYVLQEQLDWFEDEIKFVRRLLQPGQKVVDIGANYGVYALCMAHKVGPMGTVWAFEPTSATADLLSLGIAANDFTNVILERSAISSSNGTGHLSLNSNSELNAVVHQLSAGQRSEAVRLVTLDDCLQRYGWSDIGFVKIDAEGEEANILKHGKRFFAKLSPLVMYEVKAGEDLHMDLVHAFAAIGYTSYRLVPGLNVLIPFDGTMPPDNYLLNLFCCKQDRATALAACGLLIDAIALSSTEQSIHDHGNSIANRDLYHWRSTLAKLPYGIQMAAQWELTIAGSSTLRWKMHWRCMPSVTTLRFQCGFASTRCGQVCFICRLFATEILRVFGWRLWLGQRENTDPDSWP